MKISKMFILTMMAGLIFLVTTNPVLAGSKQQHRREDIAIGVGAVIVGSALANRHAYGYHVGPPVAFSFTCRDSRHYSTRRHDCRKPGGGSHHNHWRPLNRRHHGQGYYRHGYAAGNRYGDDLRTPNRGNTGRGGHGDGHNRGRN